MKNKNPRYRGLVPHTAADAPPGQAGTKSGIVFYPQTLDNLAELKDVTGIDSRSQLIRAAIEFASANKEAFKEAAGVKAG